MSESLTPQAAAFWAWIGTRIPHDMPEGELTVADILAASPTNEPLEEGFA